MLVTGSMERCELAGPLCQDDHANTLLPNGERQFDTV
jgi:hypothetical protein